MTTMQRQRKRQQKYKFMLLIRDYSNLFKELIIGRNSKIIRKKNEKFTIMCKCSIQSLEFVISQCYIDFSYPPDVLVCGVVVA